MKSGIHPDYKISNASCACGNAFVTRSTVGDIRTDICSACHPFFTGQQRLLDSTGRVERFAKKWAGKVPVAKSKQAGA